MYPENIKEEEVQNRPKLLDELRTALRMKHYSYSMEQSSNPLATYSIQSLANRFEVKLFKPHISPDILTLRHENHR